MACEPQQKKAYETTATKKPTKPHFHDIQTDLIGDGALLAPQEGPITAQGLCKGGGIVFYSGVFGASHALGEKQEMGRKS